MLRRLKSVHARVQLVVFKHGQLLNIADVPHGLELVEVLGVVDKVEHEIVLHRNVEGLHGLGLAASPGDSTIDTVLRLHESLIFILDLINDVGRVDVGAMGIPVDVLARAASLLFVVIVKEARELAMRVAGDLSGGTGSEALEPVGGEVLRAGGLIVALHHGATELRSHGRGR